jgi:hypothetical protein
MDPTMTRCQLVWNVCFRRMDHFCVQNVHYLFVVQIVRIDLIISQSAKSFLTPYQLDIS